MASPPSGATGFRIIAVSMFGSVRSDLVVSLGTGARPQASQQWKHVGCRRQPMLPALDIPLTLPVMVGELASADLQSFQKSGSSRTFSAVSKHTRGPLR